MHGSSPPSQMQQQPPMQPVYWQQQQQPQMAPHPQQQDPFGSIGAQVSSTNCSLTSCISGANSMDLLRASDRLAVCVIALVCLEPQTDWQCVS